MDGTGTPRPLSCTVALTVTGLVRQWQTPQRLRALWGHEPACGRGSNINSTTALPPDPDKNHAAAAISRLSLLVRGALRIGQGEVGGLEEKRASIARAVQREVRHNRKGFA
jgi:hypothetical protein